jgi:methyltransferase-like protein
MSQPTHSLYDEVLYPSGLYSQTHPDRLATVATLFGMSPAPVEHCRVLELGCNDGANLIAMAYALPDSRFVGIDSAEKPIAAGRALVEELGLNNIILRPLDLLETPPDLGRFDYIIAHGLYSWVPETVRDKLLAVCGAHLSDNGVAYISYNVYPGCHFRDLTRGMMRYHVAKFSEPEEKILQARALLKFLVESKKELEPYHQILQRELDRSLSRSDAALFHDDLNAINHPVYFHEFIEHAARHGLQYLSEATLRAMPVNSYRPYVIEQLNKLDPADVITREQYNDFLMGRTFRQTLLCRKEIPLYQTHPAERLYTLRFAADLRPVSADPKPCSEAAEVFKGPGGAEIETNQPLVKIALAHLAAIWPQSIVFDDLISLVQSELGTAMGAQEEAKRQLAEALLQAHLAGHIELHAHRASFVTNVTERPLASALARLQLRKGIAISTLRHQSIKIEGTLSRNLLLRLDGTRDRSTLLNDLAALVKSGEASVPGDDGPIHNLDPALEQLSEGLEKNLSELARLGLLIA